MTAPAAAPGPAPVFLALALSLGAAVSLGITRFAYGLLLPVMKSDLAWSYTLAGAMNTVNAAGYLLGALVTPWLLKRLGAARVLLWGAVLASVFMALSGFFIDAAPLLLQRLLAGVASAFVFIAGGLLAARLGTRAPQQAGLLLGLYYGGVGWGIALFEYLLQVPANRIGYTQFNVGQLKILQEVITLSVFVPFAVFYLDQPLKWDYLWAGLCMLGAVYFIFRSG